MVGPPFRAHQWPPLPRRGVFARPFGSCRVLCVDKFSLGRGSDVGGLSFALALDVDIGGSNLFDSRLDLAFGVAGRASSACDGCEAAGAAEPTLTEMPNSRQRPWTDANRSSKFTCDGAEAEETLHVQEAGALDLRQHR